MSEKLTSPKEGSIEFTAFTGKKKKTVTVTVLITTMY